MRTRHTAFYVSVYRSLPVQVKVSTRHLFVFRRNSIVIIIIELFPPLVADIYCRNTNREGYNVCTLFMYAKTTQIICVVERKIMRSKNRQT